MVKSFFSDDLFPTRIYLFFNFFVSLVEEEGNKCKEKEDTKEDSVNQTETEPRNNVPFERLDENTTVFKELNTLICSSDKFEASNIDKSSFQLGNNMRKNEKEAILTKVSLYLMNNNKSQPNDPKGAPNASKEIVSNKKRHPRANK